METSSAATWNSVTLKKFIEWTNVLSFTLSVRIMGMKNLKYFEF